MTWNEFLDMLPDDLDGKVEVKVLAEGRLEDVTDVDYTGGVVQITVADLF